MKKCNLKNLDVRELMPGEKRNINGGVIWKALAIASLAAYLHDHWECIKAGIQQELQD